EERRLRVEIRRSANDEVSALGAEEMRGDAVFLDELVEGAAIFVRHAGGEADVAARARQQLAQVVALKLGDSDGLGALEAGGHGWLGDGGRRRRTQADVQLVAGAVV